MEEEYLPLSELDSEREVECGICMEVNSKIVLPDCFHSICFKCYREWVKLSSGGYSNDWEAGCGVSLVEFRQMRSLSCPFCRESLKRVDSGDFWVLAESRDMVDVATVTGENLWRLFMYIDKLPLVVFDDLFDPYDSHLRCDNRRLCSLALPGALSLHIITNLSLAIYFSFPETPPVFPQALVICMVAGMS